MLNSFNRLSKPVQYLVIGALILVAYFAISSAFPGDAAIASKKPTHKKVTSSKKDNYTEEDYSAKFAPINVALKNSFKPLVAKAGPGDLAGAAPLALNAIPNAFVGEANWTYTGTVVIDGVEQVLFENRSSGDNVFLRNGQRWKGVSVSNITQDSVTLSAPSGQTVVLHLLTEDDTIGPGTPPIAQSAPVGPVTVNPRSMRGNIGFNNLEIRPESPSRNAENGDQNAD